jgi:hypothetical protein
MTTPTPPPNATRLELELWYSVALAEFQKAHRRIEALLRNVGDTGNCRGCGAPIYWVQHRGGARGIYDPDGASHFATCKAKDQFRRKDARQTDQSGGAGN